ncbi:CoA transferase [uncultured Brevibacterium sp.]|uniref:CoA transferase n=1 Tax=uncultured Brevibacterium sp. TaxID=189678 RepID=UPI0025F41EED|nr:CoA transferase [uncultured Brevibacterium sp.]
MNQQPLSGVTVITLAVNLPGPLAAARLASLGARVVKVEPPIGDPLSLYVTDYYKELSDGQEVVTIDLKSPEGVQQFDQLAKEADILLTAMRPKAARALGIPDTVDKYGLVHVEIVGFAGDRADVPGHDLTYQAAHKTLVPGTMPTVPVADVLGGEHAALQALAGLREKEHRGADLTGGIVKRVVLDEAAQWAAGPARHGLTGPGTRLGGASPEYRTYATSDGYIAVACLEPHFAKALAEQLGSEHEELEKAFASQPTAHWMEFANTYDLPIEPIAV